MMSAAANEAGVRASLNKYRVSAQKARLVADQVRGKGVEEALNLLDLSPKRVSDPIAKLIRSAVANAEQKNENQQAGIDIDNLIVVASIYVNEGQRACGAFVRVPRAARRGSRSEPRTSTSSLSERS